MAITQNTLTTSPAAIFTATGDTAITVITFCNSANSIDTAIDVYLVPSGSSAGASTQLINQLSLVQKNTFIMDTEKYVLENGDAIFAAANDGSIITATVSTVAL